MTTSSLATSQESSCCAYLSKVSVADSPLARQLDRDSPTFGRECSRPSDSTTMRCGDDRRGRSPAEGEPVDLVPVVICKCQPRVPVHRLTSGWPINMKGGRHDCRPK